MHGRESMRQSTPASTPPLGSLGAAVLLAAMASACGGSVHELGDGGGSSDGAGGGSVDATFDSPFDGGPAPETTVGTFNAPDCTFCKFPALTAPRCAATAAAIHIVYPNDGVLVPPDMNGISVQWTPYGAYSTYEVDFSNSVTDVRVVTKCATETMDTSQPSAASGGCNLELTQAVWVTLANANRGQAPVTITVRGTPDGKCATVSDSVKLSFAQEDLPGAIYYWKSNISPQGAGGQIWVKTFGASTPEQQFTGLAGGLLSSPCNGCHVLSRDGERMVVYSSDGGSADEYGNVTGSLIDMSTAMVIGAGTSLGQPPGFSAISPTHVYYLTSNGLGTIPTNNFTIWNGNTGTQASATTFGAAGDRPTMPDWSPDGKTVVYSLPGTVAAWDLGDGGDRHDDDHVFGASLYTLPYNGSGTFGTPSVLVKSSGENNYYPSYSPNGQYIVFDRAPASAAASAIDACLNAGMPGASCPNDSFSNPAARLMLVSAPGPATPVDMEKANGSPARSPQPLSNSWPKWSPFVQTYRGRRLLWVAFSSTRDYGVVVRNHLTGMYPCYPPDSYMQPGGAHGASFDALCQQPKLWMAAIDISVTADLDPSYPAFYLPFQDSSTHNHTPQWQQAPQPGVPVSPGCIAAGASCVSNPNACCAPLTCKGNGICAAL